MERLAVVLTVLIVAMVAVIGTAAAVTHYPTTLDSTGVFVGPGPDRFLEFGQVHSPKPACRANRGMKIVAHYPDGPSQVIDRGRSSRNGAYAMVGDFSGSNGATIRAARKVIGPRGHHRVCDPGSVPAD
jgi:hypothetical protein